MIYVDETEEKSVSDIDLAFEPRNVQVKIGKDVKKEYTLHEELGRGKFGTVYRCTEICSGRKLAAKFIITHRAEDRKDVEREVEIMRMLQQPRLLQLYDAFDDGRKEMCLILELIEGGELFERVISDDFVLTEKACSIFVRQICEGVEYMHSKNILHLDMKPENILCVTRTGNQIKIIDFGLARVYDPDKKLQVLFGTPEFVAPEVVNFDKVSYTTDMWSVGVVCYVLGSAHCSLFLANPWDCYAIHLVRLANQARRACFKVGHLKYALVKDQFSCIIQLSGLSPFMGDSDLETMGNVTKAEYDFNDESFDNISEVAKDFIAKLLLKDLTRRMTAIQSLQHPWLRKGEPKKDTKLNKKRLKRFVIRRRWQKAVNALLALKAMGATI